MLDQKISHQEPVESVVCLMKDEAENVDDKLAMVEGKDQSQRRGPDSEKTT